QGVPSCSCPDHESRGVKCKHIFAVGFTQKMRENPDGTATLAQTVTITETIRKYSFAGPGAEARLQFDPHVFNESKILNGEFAKHSVCLPAEFLRIQLRAGHLNGQ